MALKHYPDNQKVYIDGVRQKSFEHGYKLLPSFLYPTVIKHKEERVTFYQGLVDNDPDDRFWRQRLASAKASLTKARKSYERALAWDKRRDEREARGDFF